MVVIFFKTFVHKEKRFLKLKKSMNKNMYIVSSLYTKNMDPINNSKCTDTFEV